MGAELEFASVSLRTLYEELLPSVYRMAYSYLRDHHDSEDVAQEAFLRLAQSGKRFEDRRQVEAWLIVTAANLSRDLLRRKRRLDLPLEEARHSAAEEQPLAGDLRAAILALPEKYKLPIYLHYYGGYSVEEIARILHRGENTVKTWLSRGREQLRAGLDEKAGRGSKGGAAR